MAHGAEKGLHPVRQSPVPVQPRPAERLLPDGLAERVEGYARKLDMEMEMEKYKC